VSDKEKNTIIGILITIVIVFSFLFGYNTYPKWNTPDVVNDTIWRVDTVEHTIVDTFPWFVTKRDTIIYRDTIFKDIDTAKILEQFYAIHYYERQWRDTNLFVTINDAISENRLIDQTLKYEITRPQSIINVTENKYSYSRYLYFGGSITLPDAKYSNVGVYGAFSRTFFGVSYIPYQKGVMLTGGYRFLKIK